MPKYSSISEAQADGLIHYWPLNESAGQDIADPVGSWSAICTTNTAMTEAEINNTIVSTPVDLGRDISANWDNDPSRFNPIRTSLLGSSSSFAAISVRLRYYHRSSPLRSWGDTYFTLLNLFDTGGIYIEEYDGLLYADIGNQNNWSSGVATPFVAGQWHDVVIAGDSGGIAVYVNGSTAISLAGSTAFWLYGTTGNNYYGYFGSARASSPPENYYDESACDGIIQDVAIWDRRLTPTEVSDLYNAGFSDNLVTLPTSVALDTTVSISAELEMETSGAEVILEGSIEITGGIEVQAAGSWIELDAQFPITGEVRGYQDWISKLDPLRLQEVYRLTVTGAQDGLSDLDIGGISSWQATNQANGKSSYLQAVIPGAGSIVDDLAARQNGDLIIWKGFRLDDGSEQCEELARAGFNSLRYDRGPSRLTVTVSGYLSGKAASSANRTVTGVRSISLSSGKYRVRCDIDLFLQPGMIVTADNVTFTAGYINYYVNENDKFCEVGES